MLDFGPWVVRWFEPNPGGQRVLAGVPAWTSWAGSLVWLEARSEPVRSVGVGNVEAIGRAFRGGSDIGTKSFRKHTARKMSYAPPHDSEMSRRRSNNLNNSTTPLQTHTHMVHALDLFILFLTHFHIVRGCA